jgi:hypothetical protein
LTADGRKLFAELSVVVGEFFDPVVSKLLHFRQHWGAHMESTSNLQVIVDLYAAFATGNAAAMSRPFNDHSVWVESGNNTHSGVFRGPQAIAEHTMSWVVRLRACACSWRYSDEPGTRQARVGMWAAPIGVQ